MTTTDLTSKRPETILDIIYAVDKKPIHGLLLGLGGGAGGGDGGSLLDMLPTKKTRCEGKTRVVDIPSSGRLFDASLKLTSPRKPTEAASGGCVKVYIVGLARELTDSQARRTAKKRELSTVCIVVLSPDPLAMFSSYRTIQNISCIVSPLRVPGWP